MSPRLLANVGGTHVRVALETGDRRPHRIRRFRVADYPRFEDVLDAYLAEVRHPPERGALAVAAPVSGDRIRLTNAPWSFSVAAVQRRFGLEELRVINDFTAVALSIPHLTGADRRKVGRGRAVPGEAIGVIGPGTGLGVSGLIPCGGGYVPLASEGGKVTLPAFDEREAEVVRRIRATRPHVSGERLLSGGGMELLHATLAEIGDTRHRAARAAQITRRAREGDPLARETVNMFCAMLGTIAADLALTLGALGGVYVAGGIVPKLGPLFARSPFRRRFETKGRFSTYLAAIPTYVITRTDPELVGLAGLADPA